MQSGTGDCGLDRTELGDLICETHPVSGISPVPHSDVLKTLSYPGGGGGGGYAKCLCQPPRVLR